MKSTFLFLAMLVATGFPLFAQNCKFEKNEVDKFTKTTVKITKPELVFSKVAASGLGGADMLNLQVAQQGDKYSLLVRYIYSSKTAVFYNESEAKTTAPDAKLLLLLENDSIITAQAQIASVSVSHKGSSVNSMDLEFSISPENLQSLQTQTVKSIRICKSSDASQVLMEGEVKPKYSAAINRLVKCVRE